MSRAAERHDEPAERHDEPGGHRHDERHDDPAPGAAGPEAKDVQVVGAHGNMHVPPMKGRTPRGAPTPHGALTKGTLIRSAPMAARQSTRTSFALLNAPASAGVGPEVDLATLDLATLDPAMVPASVVPWRVTVVRPKGRERHLAKRARRTVNGKRQEIRITAGTDDPNEAKRQAVAWEADLNGTAPPDDPTVLAVYDAHLRRLELDPTTNRNTLRGYRTVRKILADLPLAGVRASGLTRKAVIEARNALRVGGAKGRRSGQTINGAIRHIRCAWNQALEAEQVTVEWPSKVGAMETERVRPKRAYTPREIDDVLAYLREHIPAWHPPFALIAHTGCRAGEILNLTADDVMRTEGTILVRRTKTAPFREVGVPPEVMALIPERPAGAYLFPRPTKPGKPLATSDALVVLRRVLAALGVRDGAWLDVHSFRRSFCADSEDAGVAQHQAMKQTGHATVGMFNAYAAKARGKVAAVAQQVADYRRAQVTDRAAGDAPAGVSPDATTPPAAASPTASPAGSEGACNLAPGNDAPSACDFEKKSLCDFSRAQTCDE
ncbi:MAG: site-specific integrase [Planctomycetes bacterium]|nr:site-specific integrase [Planctomycetota bacterium]